MPNVSTQAEGSPPAEGPAQPQPNGQSVLSVDDLSIEFRQKSGSVHAVKNATFQIMPGEVLALVGESGSGKSVTALTSMRLLDDAPVHYPTGTVKVAGRDMLTATQADLEGIRGRVVSMIFQEPMTALNPLMTIGAQIEEVLELHTDLTPEQRHDRIVELLQAVGVPRAEHRLSSYPHEFSGGLRQRVCIAIALACDPDLLICDEPTTALDVTIQAQILDLLAELREKKNMAMLFITHDLGVVAALADRVAVMQHGVIVEQNDVEAIFDSPQHPYTKGLLACRPAATPPGQRLPLVSDSLRD